MKKLLIISISLIMISYCSGETSSSNDQVMVEEENEEKGVFEVVDGLGSETEVFDRLSAVITRVLSDKK